MLICQVDEACTLGVVFLPKLLKLLDMVGLHRAVEHIRLAEEGFNDDGHEQVKEDLRAYDLERDEEQEGLPATAAGERLATVRLDFLVCLCLVALKGNGVASG